MLPVRCWVTVAPMLEHCLLVPLRRETTDELIPPTDVDEWRKPAVKAQRTVFNLTIMILLLAASVAKNKQVQCVKIDDMMLQYGFMLNPQNVPSWSSARA